MSVCKNRDHLSWDVRFDELQSYKDKQGDCNLLTTSGTLGSWVNTQRTQYRLVKSGKTSSMTDERVQKLVSIGFQWACRANYDYSSWDERLEERRSYKAKHGYRNVPSKHEVLGSWVNRH